MSSRRRTLLFAVYALVASALALWLIASSSDAVEADMRAALSGDGSAPVTAADALGEERDVVVASGSAASSIAEVLLEHGIIEDDRRFNALVAYGGTADALQFGCYALPPGTPTAEVIRRLIAGETTTETLVVPEGLRVEEVGALAIDAGVSSEEQWSTALASIEASGEPNGRPEDAGLIGYLMPAAFPLECDTDAATLLQAMIDSFAAQVPPEIVAEAEEQELSLHDVLTIASIVQREGVVEEELPLIASVFRNRLELEMPLAADPTVQFAIATPESVAEFGWWKRELTFDDLEVDSPYNTYVQAGLPPGPIANPGLDAILATIRPAESDFLFFVSRGDGTHVFAETFEEHSANVERFIGGQ
jgi:UPF0755 protein